MKLLTFQAQRFAWRPHERTWIGANDTASETSADASRSGSVTDAVVVFLHAETRDQEPEARDRALRHATKHIQWLANKRELKNVVLHSFTHLAADSAEASFAQQFLSDLGVRLAKKGYSVSMTPFGFTCAWELAVFGESLAKVWKEI